MGINYTNQPIVTDSLVLYYDAGNINSSLCNPPIADPKREPTIWTDLTHNVGVSTFKNAGFTNAPQRIFTVWLSARYNVNWDHYTVDYNDWGSGPSADRNGGIIGWTDPDININVGDTIIFNTSLFATLNNAAGPTWIKTATGTGSGNAVDNPTATNNGTSSSDITWTPSEAGTYYYQNGSRVNMVGELIVTDHSDNSDIGHSLIFNGTDSYGELSNTSSFNYPITTSVTLSLFVKFDTVGAWKGLLTKNRSTSTHLGLWLKDSNVAVFGAHNSNLEGSTTLTTGTWYNIVGVQLADTSRKLYINGVLDGTQTSSFGTTPSGTENWMLGKSTGQTEFLDGNIANVAIYDRALTAAEVLQNFNVIKGRFGL